MTLSSCFIIYRTIIYFKYKIYNNEQQFEFVEAIKKVDKVLKRNAASRTI